VKTSQHFGWGAQIYSGGAGWSQGQGVHSRHWICYPSFNL